MKKLILAACAALLSFSAVATTLNPIQLLNPAGSTVGQAIVSTGATTAPAWGNVSLSTLMGILPISNGGTGQTTAAAALTALGGLSTTTAASTYLTQANATSTYATITNLALKAPLASPTFTGTATSAALTATGLFTPSTTSGIKGTTLGDNANTGSVGEFPTASTASTALTSGTAANGATVTLAAGDWEVSGTAQINPSASTVMTLTAVGISTVSATRPSNFYQENVSQAAFGAASQVASTPITRISVSASTPVYLTVMVVYTGGTGVTAAPGYIRARRVR